MDRIAGVALKRGLSIFLGACGLLNLGLALWLAGLGAPLDIAQISQFILGPMLIFIGIRSYRHPVYWLTEEGFEAYNLLGMRLRVTPIAELDIDTDPNGRRKLMALRGGGRKRVLMTETSFAMNNGDVRAVIDALEERRKAPN